VQAYAAVTCVLTTQGLDAEPWAASLGAILGTKAIDLHAARLCAERMMEAYRKAFATIQSKDEVSSAATTFGHDGADRHDTGPRPSMDNASASTASSEINTSSPSQNAGYLLALSNATSISNVHTDDDIRCYTQRAESVSGMAGEMALHAENLLRQLEVSSPDCVADLISPSSNSAADWTMMASKGAAHGTATAAGAATMLHYDSRSDAFDQVVVRGGGNSGAATVKSTADLSSSVKADDMLLLSPERQWGVGSPVHIWSARASANRTAWSPTSSAVVTAVAPSFRDASISGGGDRRLSCDVGIDIPKVSSSGTTDYGTVDT
jgi:hypothetical protein